MKRAIVTGPTGAVGCALIECLVSNGIEVLAIINPNSKRVKNVIESSLVTIVPLDLNEIDNIETVLGGKKYDVFYHLGWIGTTGNSRNDVDIQYKNIEYTLKAVLAAEKAGCTRFIGAGSQAEYGRSNQPLNSETPTRPENGYGIAKLCAGQMSRLLCRQKNIEHIWTRILSVYGPGDGENSLISLLIRKLYNNEKPSLTNCEQNWDYLYSKDAGKALYLLGISGINGKIYCVGSGKGNILREYVEIIKGLLNPTCEIGYGEVEYSNKQVMNLVADISELRNDTGFEVQFSFKEGIRETIDFFLARKESKCNENN